MASTSDNVDQIRRLRRHIGLEDFPGQRDLRAAPDHVPLFFIECAPWSPNGAKCRLPSCGGRIQTGEYRVALQPGMSGSGWLRSSNQSADFYHVACFERIADLSEADFLDRLQPLTAGIAGLRHLTSTGLMDGHNFLDGGAMRLVSEWKFRRGKWVDRRDGVEQQALDPAIHNLWYRAGSTTYTSQPIPNMSWHEHLAFSHHLAPIESDGEGDDQEWNLFDAYLSAENREESLNDQHSLSRMLQRWRHDTRLALRDDDQLTDEEKQAKAQLGAKAIRGIKRLCGG